MILPDVRRVSVAVLLAALVGCTGQDSGDELSTPGELAGSLIADGDMNEGRGPFVSESRRGVFLDSL